MTNTERNQTIAALTGYDYSELCLWLCENFTPDRYRAEQADAVQAACNMLFMVYSPHSGVSLTVEFLNRLWGSHGELPDEIYNFDSHGRLTTTVPNYAKPGVRNRVMDFVDKFEPSQAMLERWGRG